MLSEAIDPTQKIQCGASEIEDCPSPDGGFLISRNIYLRAFLAFFHDPNIFEMRLVFMTAMANPAIEKAQSQGLIVSFAFETSSSNGICPKPPPSVHTRPVGYVLLAFVGELVILLTQFLAMLETAASPRF